MHVAPQTPMNSPITNVEALEIHHRCHSNCSYWKQEKIICQVLTLWFPGHQGTCTFDLLRAGDWKLAKLQIGAPLGKLQ